MSDLISRQAAIDTEGLNEEIRCEICRNPMHTDRGCDGNCKYDEKLYKKIIQILDKRIKPLPSAQQERPTGEWIVSESEEVGALGIRCKTYTCPSCGWDNSLIIPRNFCPNCGARLAQEGEDNDS